MNAIIDTARSVYAVDPLPLDVLLEDMAEAVWPVVQLTVIEGGLK